MEFVYKGTAQRWLPTADDSLFFDREVDLRIISPVESFTLGDVDVEDTLEDEIVVLLLPGDVPIDLGGDAEVVRTSGPGFGGELLIVDNDEDGDFDGDDDAREAEYFFTLSGMPLPPLAPGTDIETLINITNVDFLTITDDDEPIFTGPFATGAQLAFRDVDAFEFLGQRGVNLLDGTPDERAARVETIGRLYEGALDRDGAIDEAGLNFWVDRTAEANFSDVDLARFFTAAPEFVALFGEQGIDALAPGDYVDLLFMNFLDRGPDADGRAFWTGVVEQIDTAGFAPLGIAPGDSLLDKRAAFLVFFSESPENQENLGFLDSLAETESGIWEFVG